MKESITKFDLEAAFKALDDIDIPIAEGLKANRPAFTEIFSKKSKLDLLLEDYYDISNTTELTNAKEAREAEIAKAKLARIEKIVDLDAESPEDLLTSYVGKFIIQCPQCMTLFYKNPEDVEESEEDASTVNVNEVCQHCGNDSGYTLVGKVGEVTPEEAEQEYSDENSESSELENGENSEDFENETAEETNEEDLLDVDSDGLEELDLNLDDSETEEKKEESFNSGNSNSYLAEQLNEDTELDVSDSEFEELINSAEFKKPISDSEARVMLNAEDDLKENLTEGIFDKLKDKVANAIDKVTSSLKSREGKADWVLQNAMEDYNNIQVDTSGKLIPDEQNQRFLTFVVIGYTDKYSNGKLITQAPSFNNKDLVVGMNRPEVKKHYKDADNIAKGWSMRQGNGPAFIYLAKNENDPKAIFLCEYFKGELENDQLEKYFKVVKNDLKASKLMAKGGLNQAIESEAENAEVSNVEETIENSKPVEKAALKTASEDEVEQEGTTKRISIADLKPGMFVHGLSQIPEMKLINGVAVNILSRKQNPDNFEGVPSNVHYIVEFEGVPELTDQPPEHALGFGDKDQVVVSTQLNIIKKQAKESLNMIMSGLEELHEASLEDYISTSLIEAYANVAGFRLNSCTYLDEKFNVNGTIYFNSGNTRETTYTFNEAYIEDKTKIKLQGFNEKLGLNKHFTLTGYTEASSKTFITESFTYKNLNK